MLLSFIKKIKEHFKVNVGCFKILKQLVVYVCVCGKSVKLFYIFSQIVFCVHIHTYICRERESLLLPFQEFSETITTIVISSTTPHC